MDSGAVAREGYDAMMAGRSLVIPGLTNKIGVQALRLTPHGSSRPSSAPPLHRDP